MDASAVIDSFGGTGATARIFGVRPSAVSNWRKSGQFPARLHYRISREAAARGIALPEGFFEPRQEQPDEAAA